jgi:hypothetical protein
MSMNQENGKKERTVEMFRVRRIRDGLYLSENLCAANGNTVSMRWWPLGVHHPDTWPEAQARKIADAIIALTGDFAIEIEPVVG